MKGHRGILAAAALMLAAGPVWSQSQDNDPVANWQAVVSCAKQEGASGRHACIDGVLRAAGALDPAREVAAQRESFGESSRNDERVARPSPAGASEPTRSTEQAEQPAGVATPREISRIETTVADALIGGDRLLIVATAEGAVWKQIDGGPFRREPAKGAVFSVEEGALGSYRCKLGSDIYRCRRVD